MKGEIPDHSSEWMFHQYEHRIFIWSWTQSYRKIDPVKFLILIRKRIYTSQQVNLDLKQNCRMNNNMGFSWIFFYVYIPGSLLGFTKISFGNITHVSYTIFVLCMYAKKTIPVFMIMLFNNSTDASYYFWLFYAEGVWLVFHLCLCFVCSFFD